MTTASVRRQLRHVLGDAGVDGVTPHLFRRTVATAVNRNASIELAACGTYVHHSSGTASCIRFAQGCIVKSRTKPRFLATRTMSSRNSLVWGLGTATSFQAALPGKPDQMSSTLAADPPETRELSNTRPDTKRGLLTVHKPGVAAYCIPAPT